jgi:hypothetical protein
MSNIKNAYGTKTTITCTLTSLANAAARESTVIDNTTNLFIDALLRVKTNGQAGGTGTLEVYAYAALGDTSYTDGATGSDAAFTAANIKNARLVGIIAMNVATAVIAGTMSVAVAFGGVMPDKWGLLFKNNSGAALSATAGDHVIEYEGVYATVV